MYYLFNNDKWNDKNNLIIKTKQNKNKTKTKQNKTQKKIIVF